MNKYIYQHIILFRIQILFFLNKNIFYNFKKDTKNLNIIIEFRLTDIKVVKIWYKPINTDRMIIKHYGN